MTTTLEQLHQRTEQLEKQIALKPRYRTISTATLAADKKAAAQALAGVNAGGAHAVGKTPPSPSVINKAGLSTLPFPFGTAVTAAESLEVAGAGAGAVGLPNVASTVEHAPEAAVETAARSIFGWIQEAIGAELTKGLLYVLLAGGGVALLIAGLGRSTGTHPFRAAAHTASKAATVGAAVAA